MIYTTFLRKINANWLFYDKAIKTAGLKIEKINSRSF